MPKHAVKPKPTNVAIDMNNRTVTKQEFAKRLYQAMLNKGWTQSQVARYAGLNRDAISTYVRAKSLPSPDNLLKLATTLDVKPEELFPNYLSQADDAQLTKIEVREIHGESESMFLKVNMKVPKKVALKVLTLLQDID